MLNKRPVLIDEDNIIIGGNMRFKAAKEAGIKDVPIERFTKEDAEENNRQAKALNPEYAEKTYEEQRQEIIIKDNVSGGEWDWDMLANGFDAEQLDQWGLDTYKAEGFNENDDWAKVDDFESSDKTLKLVIQFESHDDREQFLKEYPIQIRTKGNTTFSTWWPYKDRNDFSNVKIQ